MRSHRARALEAALDTFEAYNGGPITSASENPWGTLDEFWFRWEKAHEGHRTPRYGVAKTLERGSK